METGCDMEGNEINNSCSDEVFTVIVTCNNCRLATKVFLCKEHLADPGPALQFKHACR